MRQHNTFLSYAFAASVLAAAAVPAFASPLPPGADQFPAIGEPDPFGPLVVVTPPLTSPFSAPGSFTGTLTTTVYSGDASNPLGGLTFVYVLHNDLSSPQTIESLSLNGYALFALDASYQSTAPGIAPKEIFRPPVLPVGDVIKFFFSGSGALLPGATSTPLVLQTGVLDYTFNTASVIDGHTADLIPILVPAPTGGGIPEPSSLVLAGGLGAGLLARRRRASK